MRTISEVMCDQMTVSDYKIEITGVDAYEFTNENGLIVNWQSVIGWGTTTFSFELDGSIKVDTEHMCTNDNKKFLYQLMKALVDKCEVAG